MATKQKEMDATKRIKHIRQRYTWDCGLTCILMIISEENRKQFIKDFFKICEEEGFGNTTCTIDLCYLLKRYNVQHIMYTTKQSANIKSLSVDHNANINKDAKRIKRKFINAPKIGLKIKDGALSMSEIISHTQKGPAIALVDAGLLSCDLCKHNKLSSEFRRIFGGPYQGHYIVIVGWSRNKVLYLDPARTQPVCAASPARLQAARLAPGTDCDVILVYDGR